NDFVFEALVRLHARSCLVAEEVCWLMEGGFASGAHSRWRTLHELVTVSNGTGFVRKLLLPDGIDKCGPPWDKDWWSHDPVLVRQGGRQCLRLHDGGFRTRSSHYVSPTCFRFTRSSARRWSRPRWSPREFGPRAVCTRPW